MADLYLNMIGVAPFTWGSAHREVDSATRDRYISALKQVPRDECASLVPIRAKLAAQYVSRSQAYRDSRRARLRNRRETQRKAGGPEAGPEASDGHQARERAAEHFGKGPEVGAGDPEGARA